MDYAFVTETFRDVEEQLLTCDLFNEKLNIKMTETVGSSDKYIPGVRVVPLSNHRVF
jgi:hypothetical protein